MSTPSYRTENIKEVLSDNLQIARMRLADARKKRTAADKLAQFWSSAINEVKAAALEEGVDPNDL